MKKDRFGICLTFYATLGFVLAFLGQTLLGGALLGFAIVMVQDEWLTRQTMQAFFLALCAGVISAVSSLLSPLYRIPVLGIAFSTVFGLVTGILSLAVLVLAVVGAVRAAKEKDAALPLLGTLANKAFGRQKQVVYTAPAGTGEQNENGS